MFADMLLRCPVGCNFLWTIERDRVPLEQALAPEQAIERATIALRDLNPWSVRASRARSEALERGAQLEGLARGVAAHPAIHWWAEPCDLSRQVLLTDDPPPWAQADAAQSAHDPWEDYAQRPAETRTTSTLHGALSSADVEIAVGTGDWGGSEQFRRSRAVADKAVSVFEITSPADWHELSTTVPRVVQGSSGPSEAGTLVPDWRRLAGQYDGVHLTFAGLLTTPFVRETSAAGTTMLWSWDAEMTMWLPDAVRPGTALPVVDTRPLRSGRIGRIEPVSRHPAEGRIFQGPGPTALLWSLLNWYAIARDMWSPLPLVAKIVVARFAGTVARTLRRAIGRARTDSDRR